jgi:hypothetical protein
VHLSRKSIANRSGVPSFPLTYVHGEAGRKRCITFCLRRPFGWPPFENVKCVPANGSAMNNIEGKKIDPLPLLSSRTKGHTSRCHQCNGRFGLIRHRLVLKQFCSARCLEKYKRDIERTTTRIKEWAHFLSRKL